MQKMQPGSEYAYDMLNFMLLNFFFYHPKNKSYTLHAMSAPK